MSCCARSQSTLSGRLREFPRLDFRRLLESGLCSSPRSAGSFPEQRLVIEPRIIWNRCVPAKALSFNFSSNCACTSFNWVLSIKKKNSRMAGFFETLPFLTYLCYKKPKPSTHRIQLRRKIAKIEQALSKQSDRCINDMFVFVILVRAESHQEERARQVCSPTLGEMRDKLSSFSFPNSLVSCCDSSWLKRIMYSTFSSSSLLI